jgi:hypothetical protein
MTWFQGTSDRTNKKPRGQADQWVVVAAQCIDATRVNQVVGTGDVEKGEEQRTYIDTS